MTVGRILVPGPLPDGFALFYTTADYDGAIVPELTETLRDRFGIEATLVTCTQVHGKTIGRAEARPTGGSGVEPSAGQASPCPSTCDALFTDQRNIALGIKVADCLPVSLCDPVHRVIANIHSGWRGAVQNITAETLDTLARETAFEPGVAYAYLGPSIRVCCFEVGEEVAAQFDERWIDRGRGAKPHIDLAQMTESILRERGVAHVIDTGFCTRCNPLFHSYRRDKKSGRNLAIAAQ
jgi:YfiH family protein